MSDYTQVTDFSAKDALTTGDAEKAISGADVDGEFSAISTAIATKIDEPGSPSTDDLLVWSGSAWAAKDIGVDGSAGQSYVSDGTNASWTTSVSHTYVSDISGASTYVFSSIPSWVKQIEVSISGASCSGTNDFELVLGDSGGVEITGYAGTYASAASTSGALSDAFVLVGNNAEANAFYGTLVLGLMDSTSNLWAATWVFGRTNNNGTFDGAGTKALSGTLTQIQLQTSGANTIDAGAATIRYW